MNSEPRPLLQQANFFWFFLAALTALRLIYINLIPLTPQEAYYWYYSQYPALSYFDHPPMAAWSIWLGTHLSGNTIFGIKLAGVFWSALTNILLYFTTLRLLSRSVRNAVTAAHIRTANIAVLLYNLSIFAHVYALTIMPDTPLLFFWLLVIFCVQEAVNRQKPHWWLIAGAALGLGLVSKYTAIAIVPGIFVYLIIDPERRRLFLKPYPYLALLLAAIVFLPVIYWNSQHDWASFMFQFGDRARSTKSLRLNYFGQLIASQMFMLTPLLLVLFLRIYGRLIKNWIRLQDLHFMLLNGIFIIGGFVLLSFKTLIKMNWLLPGYLGLTIATAILFRQRFLESSRWMKSGITFSLMLIVLAHALWLVPNIPIGEGNTWSGWSDASGKVYKLQQELGGRKKTFIFANSYKSASLLKFYLPDQQDVYAQNIYGQPALQFDIWPLPDSLAGKDALYIFTDRREYKNDLKKVEPFFEQLSLLKQFEYRFRGKKVRTIYCYLGKNYKGTTP